MKNFERGLSIAETALKNVENIKGGNVVWQYQQIIED